MAELFVDEGIDAIMGVLPKNGTNFANLYLGLFTSQSATTVPARTATGGASPSGWTEAVFTNYARQTIAAADWGAASTNGNGRKISASQKTFPTVGVTGSLVNGFFVATASASGASDKIIYFANFDDGAAVDLHTNDVIKVTPSMQFDG